MTRHSLSSRCEERGTERFRRGECAPRHHHVPIRTRSEEVFIHPFGLGFDSVGGRHDGSKKKKPAASVGVVLFQGP
jgi:hypothetical protein